MFLEVTIPGMENDKSRDQAGLPGSLEQALSLYWDRIYAVAFRIVGDRYEAEDLALETFWRLHQDPPRQDDNLLGWLYRVATNLGLNALRSRQRRQERETRVTRWEAAARSDNPVEQVERRLEQQRVRKVLRQMKSRDARLLILRHSGLTYAEVAEALQSNPNSIGKLLSRAEAAFEQLYRRQEREA